MTFQPKFSHLEKRLKRHVSGPSHVFRAFAHLGFEGILSAELSRLGINHQKNFPGGLLIEARLPDAWKICAFSRTLRRLDMEIAQFRAENFGRLEKEFDKIPWELFIPMDSLPQIKVKTKKSRLYHSDAVKERLENILKEKIVSTDSTSVQKLRVELDNDTCKIYVDMGGAPLYKRGYDKFVEAAPLQDSLAASILLAGGILNTNAVLDPMCGSGTFSLEAAFMAKGIYPLNTRNFAFETHPAFRKESWKFIKEHPPLSLLQPGFSIKTSDLNEKCVKTAFKNAVSSKTEDLITPVLQDFFEGILPHTAGSLLVLNPPYGLRLQTNTKRLYSEIGNKIRSDYRDCRIALLCPDHTTLHAFSSGVISATRTNHGGLNIFVVFAEARKL